MTQPPTTMVGDKAPTAGPRATTVSEDGVLSQDRARVLAMRTARETPGEYGSALRDIPMAFEVEAEEETEEYYVTTLAFRPQGRFEGAAGKEQFYIGKTGGIDHRQVLDLPSPTGGRRFPMVPVAFGLAAVAAASVGVLFMAGALGGDNGETAPASAVIGDATSSPAAVIGDDATPAGPGVPAAGETPAPAPTVAPTATVPVSGALSAPTPTAGPVSAATAAPTPAGDGDAAAGVVVQGQGTAIIFDDAGLNDAMVLKMSGVSPPPKGKEYVGWLITDDWSFKKNTGAMQVQDGGTISHTFASSSESYTGADLIAIYSKLVITQEDLEADPAASTGQPAFIYEVPLGAMTHIRHLMSAFPTGAQEGIFTNLRTQLRTALFHCRFAIAANTLAGAMQHSEHVVNVIEGPGGLNYGDLDGNELTEDPGDGVGVLKHVDDSKHAVFAARQAPDDPVIGGHAELVVSYAEAARALAVSARDRALLVFDAEDLESARAVLGPGEATVIDMLEAALNGTGPDGENGAL